MLSFTLISTTTFVILFYLGIRLGLFGKKTIKTYKDDGYELVFLNPFWNTAYVQSRHSDSYIYYTSFKPIQFIYTNEFFSV